MGLRNKAEVPLRSIDLQELALELCEILSDTSLTIYLFGSRKEKTGSTRSDVDLLIELPRRASDKEAGRIWDAEPYLDVFALDHGIATSLVNESQLRAKSNRDVVRMVGAVCLMRKGSWLNEADEYRHQTVLSDRNPAASLIGLYDLVDAIPAERADLLVVTALTEEYDAVLSALGTNADTSSTLALLTDAGQSQWRIRVLNMHEMGSVGAAIKTADAIRRSKPSHVVLVGICAGIPGRSSMLDVIVPEAVLYYEPAKVTDSGAQGGYAQRQCDAATRGHLAVLARSLGAPNIRAEGEIIGCGEKVIADETTRDLLKTQHRKLAALDMESYGVIRAAEQWKIPATVIKSVCDMADTAKSDNAHDDARQAAAEFFVTAARNGVFRAKS